MTSPSDTEQENRFLLEADGLYPKFCGGNVLTEVSTGVKADEIFAIIQRINREEKVTILLVEQNARIAITIADHGYVMENGRIVLDDSVEKPH